MKPRIIGLVLLFMALSPLPLRAMWMRYETEQVPVTRLLTNLEKRLATNRENVEILYFFARVHSMAYATNLSTVPVTKTEGEPMFYHPGSDSGVPRKVSLSPMPLQQAAAHRHLTNAIRYYERAAKLVLKSSQPEARWLVVPIHLGLAWCLDQDGRRQEAIDAYRDALQHAWRQEVDGEFTLKERARFSWDQLRSGSNPLKKPRRGYIGPGVCYSDEIIGYLLKLLDPKADAKEIAQLEADRKELRSMGRAVTPILVPLRDGLALDQLVDPAARVAFDLDGSGEARRWGWLTTNAAWLVFDHDDSGRITSGLQMFGNVTFWIFWRNGYDALASLDDDADGQLAGDELNHLSLWHDRNGNGVSEAGEVAAVTRFGIISIDCRSEAHSSGIPFSERGVSFRDGGTRPTYDWIAPAH